MDIPKLAKQMAALLAPAMPYLRKSGGKAGKEISVPVQELWQRLQPKLEGNASAMGAVSDLENEPDDPDLQAVFRVQLRKILIDDANFTVCTIGIESSCP